MFSKCRLKADYLNHVTITHCVCINVTPTHTYIYTHMPKVCLFLRLLLFLSFFSKFLTYTPTMQYNPTLTPIKATKKNENKYFSKYLNVVLLCYQQMKINKTKKQCA